MLRVLDREGEKFIENITMTSIHLMGSYRLFLMVIVAILYCALNCDFNFQVLDKDTIFEIMDFLNSRDFQKENPLRRRKYRQGVILALLLVVVGNISMLSFCLFPLIEQKNGTPQPMHFPVDIEKHREIYWIMYLFCCCSIYISSIALTTSCLQLNNIMAFLSNEFRILGNAYECVFDEVSKDEDAMLDQVVSRFRENAIHQERLYK